MKIPGFIARQFYVEGSLQNTPNGFQLQAQNPMGNGVLTGVGQLRVDGREVDPSSVTAQRDGDPQPMSARDVSPANPVNVSKGDRVTLHVEGAQLAPGRTPARGRTDGVEPGRSQLLHFRQDRWLSPTDRLGP